MINLGIKVPPEDLIQAWREHQPDAIGLSGLLVKSAHQMVTTASDFKDHGVGRSAAGGRRGALGKIHDHAHRPGLRRADVLRERRDDRPAHHERADGPGDARGRASARTFSPTAAAARWRLAPRSASGDRAQPESAHRYSDSRRALSRPPRARRSEPAGDLELHQSVHALRPASRLQGQFRKAAAPSAIRRRWSCFSDVEKRESRKLRSS